MQKVISLQAKPITVKITNTPTGLDSLNTGLGLEVNLSYIFEYIDQTGAKSFILAL